MLISNVPYVNMKWNTIILDKWNGTKQTNSVALSPRANYTDWSTATCRRILVSTFVDREVSRGSEMVLEGLIMYSV
jgi:hypothetical protein